MTLIERAENILGKERTEELRADIRQLAEDIEKVRSVSVDVDDEP